LITVTTDEVWPAWICLANVLVTGVSSGLGVETAKAEPATVGVRVAAAAAGGSLNLVPLDLANLSSVRAAADALVAASQLFDIVIANTGLMATPFGKTADGFAYLQGPLLIRMDLNLESILRFNHWGKNMSQKSDIESKRWIVQLRLPG
jgi:NAD(P)-dependent dehydrogenase (short-subunit alcohol dehydrogenase family)